MEMEGSDIMLFWEYKDDWEKERPVQFKVKEIRYEENLEKFLNDLPPYAEVVSIMNNQSWFTVVVRNTLYKEEETNVDK